MPHTIDGAQLSLLYTLPFAALLAGIALLPLWLPHFWHSHHGKLAFALGLCVVLGYALEFGAAMAGQELVHALLLEYIPFIALLAALFTVSGGIYVSGNLHGSPKLNTGILLLGTLLASVMGTTGAAMLLVRPLIRANDNRRHHTHVFVFFIFLVANIGGSLTPLGDPPLFLGFLKGVAFFWTAEHIFLQTLFLSLALLLLFYAVDSYYYRKEGVERLDPTPDDEKLQVHGWQLNGSLLLGILALVLLSGFWKSGIALAIAGMPLAWSQLLRDLGLLAIIGISLRYTAKAVRDGNQFSWEPMQEVAKLFVGIFITMIPVLAMLRAGVNGPFASIVSAVTDAATGAPKPAMYFWATGMLSGFLDNAPTYLVFFNLAGGDAVHLMGAWAATLAAISAGAVFMGALSYIGNAPNLMVKSIVENRGLQMPSFFGYMLWSFCILLPLFAVLTLLFYRTSI